eukprot:TRINITY_DN15560_c0_g1_i5.p1 TRINITY_DN15560_c0_g1~~TRINITY_DN15560_c0_g1_i5.p1  ORF type:complete len:3059 (+),score=454.29 TRINITY_DN15560_c0_g1_i5:148-9177(+)
MKHTEDIFTKSHRCITTMKEGNEQELLRAKKELGKMLREALLEMEIEGLQEIEQSINLAIYDCFAEGKQIIGIHLINELVGVEYMEVNLKTTRFANYLRGALPTESSEQAALVAKTLSKVALEGGILASEVIEAELRRCVEWLAVVKSTRDSGNRRYAAILVIDELSVASPHILAPRLEVILAHISNGFHDIRISAQQACTHMLLSLLKLLNDRSIRTRDAWTTRLYEDAQSLLETNRHVLQQTQQSQDTIAAIAYFRGGYLMLRALYQRASDCLRRSTLLLGKFAFVLDCALEDIPRCKSLPAVIESITMLVSAMAAYHSEGFAHWYLHRIIDVYNNTLKGNVPYSIKAAVLASLDKILCTAGCKEPSIAKPKLPTVISLLKTELCSSGNSCNEAIGCIAAVAELVPADGVSIELEGEVLSLVTLALRHRGVNSALYHAVARIGRSLATIKDELNKKLLQTIKSILTTYQQPKSANTQQKQPSARKVTIEEVIMALEMLENVTDAAPEKVILGKVWIPVSAYHQHSNQELRLVSVTATGNLLRKTINHLSTDFPVIARDILQSLLQVIAGDACAGIRLAALKALPHQLDLHLCRPPQLKILVAPCYDVANHENRLCALDILGRICPRNPAIVHPPLKKLLVNTLHELALSKARFGSTHEQGSELLGYIILAAPKLARMFVVSIRDTLLRKLQSPGSPPSLKTCIMKTLYKLASVGGTEVQCTDQVIVVIISLLEEGKPGLQQRLACLQCLGSLLRAVSWDVHPYIKYPQLLSTLLRMLQLPQASPTAEDELKRGVLRCLGVAGAYEPYQLKMRVATKELLPSSSPPVTTDFGSPKMPTRTSDAKCDLSPLIPSCGGQHLAFHLNQYNPSLCIRVMLKVINDVTLPSVNHKMAVGAIVMICRTIETREITQFLSIIYQSFLGLLSTKRTTDEAGLVSFFIQQLKVLTITAGLHARPYITDMIIAVSKLCEAKPGLESEILLQILLLLTELRERYREGFAPHMQKVVPILVLALNQKKVVTVCKALTCMEVLGPLLDTYATTVIPPLLRCFSKQQLDSICAARQTKNSPKKGTGSMKEKSPGTPRKKKSNGSEPNSPTAAAKKQKEKAQAQQNTGSVPSSPKDVSKEGANSLKVAQKALHTLAVLSDKMSLREFVTPILQTFIRILSRESTERKPATGIQSSGGGPSAGGSSMGGRSKRSHSDALPTLSDLVPLRKRQMSDSSNTSREGVLDSLVVKTEYMTRIHQLEVDAVAALCCLVPNLRPDSKLLESTIAALVQKRGLSTEIFRSIVLSNGKLPDVHQTADPAPRKHSVPDRDAEVFRDLTCNPRALSNVLEVTSLSSTGDWIEWMRVFSIELIRESPSAAIRSCGNLAQLNLSVRRELFNAAFVSCYLYLPQPQKGHLLQAVVSAIKATNIPPDVLQSLLSLAEFMEHMEVSGDPSQKPKSVPSCPQVQSCVIESSEIMSVEIAASTILAESECDNFQEKLATPKIGTPDGLFVTTAADVLRGAPTNGNGNGSRQPKITHGMSTQPVIEPVDVKPPLPLPPELELELLAEKAEKCQLYTKALHYRELVFIDHLKREVGGLFGQYVDGYVVPFTPIRGNLDQGFAETTWNGWVRYVTQIIRINQHLRNQHSAQGILTFALENFDRVLFTDGLFIPKVEASIYAELHQWDRAKEEWLLVLQRIDTERAQAAHNQNLQQTSQSLSVTNLPSSASPRPSSGKSIDLGGWNGTSSNKVGQSSGDLLWSSSSPASNSTNNTNTNTTPSLIQIASGYRNKTNYERIAVLHGLIKALRALGEWSEVLRLSKQISSDQTEVAEETARAAWMLREWGDMENATTLMEPDNIQKHIHLAVLSVQKDDLKAGTMSIEDARKLIQPDIAALASESYSRAYPLIVKLQVLSELEEVISWKRRGGIDNHEPEELQSLLQRWKERLERTERRTRFWEECLAIRGMLVPPAMQLECWLKFVSIAWKAAKPSLAENTLKMLLGINDLRTTSSANPTDPVNSQREMTLAVITEKLSAVNPLNEDGERIHPHLYCASCEYLWNAGDRELATQLLSTYLDKLTLLPESKEKYSKITGRYYRRLGQWHQEQHIDSYWLQPHRAEVMRCLRNATTYDEKCWKNWHTWALMNHRVVRRAMIHDYRIIPFVNQAAHGFMVSIQENSSSVMQDLLRLLGLWFAHGHIKQVETRMRAVLQGIATNNWLSVIPQIVARLSHPNKPIRALIHQLIANLGKEHGQAIVYPLICVLCSEDPKRAQAGKDVFYRIQSHHPKLVSEGKIVATSLAKVALILAEQWTYGIDEARWLYYTEKDVHGALKTFKGLHQLMETPPTSEHESLFHQQFSSQLATAHAVILTAEKYLEAAALDKVAAAKAFREKAEEAWMIYSKVLKEIERRLSKMPSLDLEFANPELSRASDLSIAVPGTYRPYEPVVTIASFGSRCHIIPSKQRPRRITIIGANGSDYMFLLKGREDLRQDERVMQLFTLINQLLNEDRTTAKMYSSIELYPVIPLASSAGLIGWLRNAETLFSIVKEYRISHRTSLTLEKSLIPEMVESGYDKLSLYQKVDVFEYILERSCGDDLARMMWLKSRSSEVWLASRTTYTRSLGVMSMVGFIMGLGDRHPSNLMLDVSTRKVIHIDFGDCFEVASRRSKFPEKVPFRLTRVLIKAMDLAGVEGLFKRTSEDVMKVLRKNKDSLMSMLSSFLHDPLINWRLIDPGKLREADVPSTDRLTAMSSANSIEYESYADSFFVDSEGSTDGAHTRDLRHRSIREHVVRSVLSRRDEKLTQNVVTNQAIGALNRIRQKLDGIAYRVRLDERNASGPERYNFDYHDPLFVGETTSINAPPTLSEEMCGECEAEYATVRCDDCCDVFCKSCVSVVHAKRRNRNHTDLHPIASSEFSVRSHLKKIDLTASLTSLPCEIVAAITPHVVKIQSLLRGYLSRVRRARSVPSDASKKVASSISSFEAQPEKEEAPPLTLDATDQVMRLITEATAHENLAVAYPGWCPWW